MDPDVALHNIRALVAIAATLTPVEAKADLADELASAIMRLDDWLCRGGFLPAAWTHLTLKTCRENP